MADDLVPEALSAQVKQRDMWGRGQFPLVPGYAEIFPGSAEKIPVLIAHGNSGLSVCARAIFSGDIGLAQALFANFPGYFPGTREFSRLDDIGCS